MVSSHCLSSVQGPPRVGSTSGARSSAASPSFPASNGRTNSSRGSSPQPLCTRPTAAIGTTHTRETSETSAARPNTPSAQGFGERHFVPVGAGGLVLGLGLGDGHAHGGTALGAGDLY